MTHAPRRPVVEVKEVVGPRGGRILVLLLSCKHWKTAPKPATSATCIACYIEAQLKKEP